jgi:rhamnosyltransferase
MLETSIIIRTRNEEKWLSECLNRLRRQTYRDFEILIIDSGSSDRTLDIAKRHATRILSIPSEDFSYPYASNFGCRHAQGKKYFVFLSGHSLPLTDTWLEDGLSHFSDKKVAGVYGNVQALPGSGLWEWIFFNPVPIFIRKKLGITIRKTASDMGVLGCTNAIIRIDLWKQHSFDERYGNGGEDTAWADYWLKRGYVIINDARFSVAHSHGLGFLGLIKQWKHWESTSTPQSFHRKNFTYRNKS